MPIFRETRTIEADDLMKLITIRSFEERRAKNNSLLSERQLVRILKWVIRFHNH